MRKGKLRLGAFLRGPGHHVAAWRHPQANAEACSSFDHYSKLAAICEDAKLDMLFLSDSLALNTNDIDALSKTCPPATGHFEPITMLSALATATRQIGLVGTASTTYFEPYNIARIFASLDQISQGRAGWNVVTSTSEMEAANFGRERLHHGDRYAIATEFCEVVTKLWGSWEPDAFVRDKQKGQYFIPEKLHIAGHKGSYFNVTGPLPIGPSPQERPIIVVAGASDPGRELAANFADVMFTAEREIDAARKMYSDVKGRLGRYSRNADDLKIMPGIMPVIGKTQAEAQCSLDELQELILPQVGRQVLASILGTNLGEFPDDHPFPELPTSQGQQSRQDLIVRRAREKNYTIREAYLEAAGARAHNIVVGTPVSIADMLCKWFETQAADGFNIMPPILPGGLEEFVSSVVPELQNRGLFRSEYEFTTLRGNLGL